MPIAWQSVSGYLPPERGLGRRGVYLQRFWAQRMEGMLLERPRFWGRGDAWRQGFLALSQAWSFIMVYVLINMKITRWLHSLFLEASISSMRQRWRPNTTS